MYSSIFQNFNHGLTQLAADCPHVVTHTYQYAKAGVEVLWTAPPSGAGCVEFRYGILDIYKVFSQIQHAVQGLGDRVTL